MKNNRRNKEQEEQEWQNIENRSLVLGYTKVSGTRYVWYVLSITYDTSMIPFFFFFFPSPSLSSPFRSLSRLVVTQIRGHIPGSSPPLPTTVRALHLYRGNISALSSLVDSRRIVRTHARRSQQLILFFYFFLRINSKSRHGGIRTHGQH